MSLRAERPFQELLNEFENLVEFTDDTRLRELVRELNAFATTRLTEAARMGLCHHCNEALIGVMCWWCGLRRST